MIDLHFHALPGIDDGPGNLDRALDLVRRAALLGATKIVATPHVSWRYRNTAESIASLVVELNQAIARELGDGVTHPTIIPGAEISANRLPELAEAEVSALRLGDGQWLLIEPPFSATATGLDVVVADLHNRGYRVVLAHPERCPAFHRDPRMLRRLVTAGAITSVTAGALVGRFGRAAARFARSLAAAGLVHNVASDAHNLRNRPPGIIAELQEAGMEPLTDWLTVQVPSAILDGAESIPPRPLNPTAAKPRRWGQWHSPARL